MPRKTRVKQHGQGGKTRGRHKKAWSRETKLWKAMMNKEWLRI